MFWPGAQTEPERKHIVLTVSLNASNTYYKNTVRNACTNAHACIKKQHMCAHTLTLLKQIRSDASACVCQEHAERTLERERAGLVERRCACIGCDMPASACQDHAVPMPSAEAHKQ